MMKFNGIVTKGLGEGAFYVEIYKEKIKTLLGITPFFGTLNLKCNNSFLKEIEKSKDVKIIEGFNGLKGAKFIKCVIKKNKIKHAWIVIPEIRKHNFVEVISDVCLREELNLKDGDVVEIEI